MVARRAKLIGILASAGVSALALLAWTQQWFDLELTTGTTVSVNGDVAAPALSALALAGLALSAALGIAGRVFGVVLGVLEAALGALVLTSGSIAVGDPVLASASAVTAATAVSGDDAVRELVASVAQSPWPWLTVLIGALMVIVGGAIAVTARRWPAATRKYQAVRFAETDAHGDAVDVWDAMSDGTDPTREP